MNGPFEDVIGKRLEAATDEVTNGNAVRLRFEDGAEYVVRAEPGYAFAEVVLSIVRYHSLAELMAIAAEKKRIAELARTVDLSQ